MEKKTPITQPSPEAEKLQRDIAKNTKTKIVVRGTTFNIGGIYNDTLERITDIVNEEEEDSKVTAKCAAAVYLNGFFKLRLFFWIVWRWFYYVKQFNDSELAPVIVEAKKKVEEKLTSYLVNTILLIDLKTTAMAMTRKEANLFRQGQIGGGVGTQQSAVKEESSSRTSSSPGTSSSAS